MYNKSILIRYKKGGEILNSLLLKSKMTLFGDNTSKLSEALGISTTRTCAKINAKNGAQFTQKEIKVIKDRYELTDNEIVEIFFGD